MKDRKRKAAVLLLLSLLITIITGCGGKGKTEPSAASAASEEAPGKQEESGSLSPREGEEVLSVGGSDAILEAVFFDVGKGDCILFTSGDRHVLLDAGYEETSDYVIDRLRQGGVDSLDAMIISHYDKDHVGGAAEIASQIPVGTFYLPDYRGEDKKCGDLMALIEQNKLASVQVSSVEELSVGPARVYIHPALTAFDPLEENDNDASLIVEVIFGDDQWLLPGDIEEESIEAWIQTNEMEYDILKYPHHGKKEKNAADFIKNVSPEITVITDSAEEDASKKVLKKLDEEGADVYRSSENGTITIRGDGRESFQVTSEK